MKTPYIFFAVFCIVLSTCANAQVIPDSLRVDWSQAGYQGVIPDPSVIINVKDFGAFGDGVHDDYNAVINAINSSAAFRVIYFPAGNYLIKSTIKLTGNVVMRGDGERSNLRFDLSQYKKSTDCINIIKNQNAAYTNVVSGYTKGSSSIISANSTAFSINSYAEIIENNGDWDPDKTNPYVGQIVKITGKIGNRLDFIPALRIDYIDSLQPKIRAINLAQNIGLECFKITRLDTPTINYSGRNIIFQYANNCWVTGVESEYCQSVHIAVIACTHITLSGCYIHDAFTYNGGGQGYGIFMHGHTSDSKVENSIFERLRHAMIVASGANGNVYAYNYSTDARSTTEVPPDNIGDLSLHGNYAYANLFEGNIVQNIIVDDYWGASGPYNTFFRNRAELYGIEILDQYNYAVKSDRQNMVGNEMTNTDSLKGNYYVQTNDHFSYDNNARGIIIPANTNILNDASYYLTAKPYFWNVNSAWPSIGGFNVLGSGTNPAKERYLSGESKTVCLKAPSTNLQITAQVDSIMCNGDSSKIIITASGGKEPYQGIGSYYKPAGSYVFNVKDAFGYNDSIQINLSEPNPITALINATNTVGCSNNGIINIENAAGGKKPYQYSINGNYFTDDSTFKNLSEGKYIVWIKDSNNCAKKVDSIFVSATPAFTLSAKTTKASASKNDGTIIIKRTGGKGPFQYSLNNIDYISTNVFYNLDAGSYTAWVKDKTGCVNSLENIIVSRVVALKVTVQRSNVSCKNANDGKITIKASGGTAPYLYSLDSINFTSNNIFTNLSAGTYKAWIKDAVACTAFAIATINNSKITCSPANAFAVSDLELNISVLPNPSTQKFELIINSNKKEAIQFFVTDIYGREIYNAKGAVEKHYVFGENFIPGIYMLKLIQGNISKTYKIIKQ